jgi:hypothetical protein
LNPVPELRLLHNSIRNESFFRSHFGHGFPVKKLDFPKRLLCFVRSGLFENKSALKTIHNCYNLRRAKLPGSRTAPMIIVPLSTR